MNRALNREPARQRQLSCSPEPPPAELSLASGDSPGPKARRSHLEEHLKHDKGRSRQASNLEGLGSLLSGKIRTGRTEKSRSRKASRQEGGAEAKEGTQDGRSCHVPHPLGVAGKRALQRRTTFTLLTAGIPWMLERSMAVAQRAATEPTEKATRFFLLLR